MLKPDIKAWLVFFPKILVSLENFIFFIPEANDIRFSYEVVRPGKITPPKYLLLITISKVVAVPKSIIMKDLDLG